MANRGKSHRHGRGRGRSRKRRPAPGATVIDATREAGRGETDQTTADQTAVVKNARAARARSGTRASADFRDPLSVGKRPPAPWHPWPLSEMLILVGGIGMVVGLARLGHGGISNGGPVLFAGLGAVVLGTVEMILREHRAGYRSHTLILTLLPIIVLDTALAFGVAAFITPVPVALKVGVLVLDLPVFAFLYKLLRAQFLDARARVVSRR